MKIGMVSDTFLPQLGGAEIHVYNLSRMLRECGHEVSIFTNTDGTNYLDEFEVVRNHPKKFFSDFIALINFLKNVNVVHCHYTYYLSSIACIVSKILRKPSVVTLHGLGTLDSSVRSSWKMKAFRWISFKFADKIIGTSDEMVEVAKRFVNDDEIYMIPNAVDSTYFKPNNNSKSTNDKIIVLSARRLSPKNGVQYLIEAIPYILKEFDRIEFWVMGRKKLESYLKKRVRELKIENFVKFIGEIPNENTKDYYNIADIVVFPSSAESTSIACLEAMSMKKAVIASSLEVYKKMLGNNERGILIKLFESEYSDYNAPLSLPDNRSKDLANAILTLSKDNDLRKKLGKSARKHVKKYYDWKLITSKIVEIYKSHELKH